MSDRAEFLARVSAALARRVGDPVPPPPPLDEELVRRVADGEALTDRFATEVRNAGGEVVRTPAGVLPPTVAALLVDSEITYGIVDRGAQRLGIAEACERVGVEVVPLAEASASSAGITGVNCAIAETGTVVLDAGVGAPRGTSLLPEVHIAIVLESQIVADQIDALRVAGDMPSSRVWITGPSKTADIEGILVTGVHGPARWVVAIAEGV